MRLTAVASEPDLEYRLRELLLTDDGRGQIAVFAAIPEAVLDVWAGFYWDVPALYALTSPVHEVDVADFAWTLDIPIGRDGDRLFAMGTRKALAEPDRHPERRDRIEAADLSCPIALFRARERTIVLDGYHRLAKATSHGMATLPARMVTDEDLPHILIRDGFLGELNRLRESTPGLTVLVRRVAQLARDHV